MRIPEKELDIIKNVLIQYKEISGNEVYQHEIIEMRRKLSSNVSFVGRYAVWLKAEAKREKHLLKIKKAEFRSQKRKELNEEGKKYTVSELSDLSDIHFMDDEINLINSEESADKLKDLVQHVKDVEQSMSDYTKNKEY